MRFLPWIPGRCTSLHQQAGVGRSRIVCPKALTILEKSKRVVWLRTSARDRIRERFTATRKRCHTLTIAGKRAPRLGGSRFLSRSFASMASAAVSFRSRCGSVRGAPECSSQTSPIAAPQVGQGTDNVWLGVSSLTFTATYCNVPTRKSCSILLNQKTLAELKGGGR